MSGMMDETLTIRDAMVLDTAIHYLPSQMELLRVQPNGVVHFPDVPHARPLDTTRGRLRLIFIQCLQYRVVGGGGRPSEIPFQHQCAQLHQVFPLRKVTLDDIVFRMDLPADTQNALWNTSSNYWAYHFQSCPPQNGRKRLGVTMKLPDAAIVGNFMALSLSHCSETNITEGLILVNDEDCRKKLASAIISARTLAAHPTALPMMVCELFVQIINKRIEDTWSETFKLETDSQQSGIILAVDRNVVRTENPGSRNGTEILRESVNHINRGMGEQQLALNKRSVTFTQLSLGWEYYANVSVFLLERIGAFLECNDVASASDEAISAVKEDQLLALKERLSRVFQHALGLVALAKYQRERLNIQRSELNSLLALDLGETSHTIAAMSWKESMVMRYIAMVGLVATCIAPSLQPNVYFWVAAIPMPLSLVAVILWVKTRQWRMRGRNGWISQKWSENV